MITNRLNLPQPFVDAATSNHEYKPHRYSVTEVLGGTCEAVLKRRHHGEGEEDVADRVFAIFGTAVHKVLQEAEATDTQLQENWLSVPVRVGESEEYELSGIFDLYDDATGKVTDYKTTSVWTVLFGDFDKWRNQCLAYCWMLRQHGFDAHSGEIVAILRDHNQRKARTERDYPPHPVFRIGWDFSDADFSEVEADIFAWFANVVHEETVPDDQLEPCTPEQRWHKPDKWAVMRRGQKRAVKLFDTESDALGFMDWLADKPSNKGRALFVEFRKGEDTKCESYCPVAQFCPHHRDTASERTRDERA